ncbi:hypothetical protein [Paenibacillus eucommiae]|uniref:Lipoprotein n=1 Tax=Paenibacillus eucommiae TaxID=1355755 RepID=A0ABS4J3Q5_9BACL|nr:hypothetical protein [Paenibacillus eucommiae]MBP1993731.1 hypothetical protein [Paenibacillus eucommiae]
MGLRKRHYLLFLLVFILLIAGCGGKEKTDEEKLAEVIQEHLGNVASTPSNEEPTVEGTLREINKFLTSDIWNEGFVNISWYVKQGTGSTGETLDIDFTIERLGKTMVKKKEYDDYINGLNEEYDGIKQVWTKLSGEIDRLYAQIQANPPVAKDDNYDFDTGLYQQYKDAFSDDVKALQKR